jgi:hypothetical protein
VEAQSLAVMQLWPAPQRGHAVGPPQSTPLSAPSRMPFTQLEGTPTQVLLLHAVPVGQTCPQKPQLL